ncbi:putative addiction module antidote protein [Ancylobacter sp. A5.8]|uniref:addiction module antidote protein n=1 Tax=Ancylobacter gelatini TaxID=2919920 RepID=UPI001F4E602B|nr:addiction module antidote protein [Ancylobacter gelatini]MCJ8141648.1 putative addiction module antidote protein [Ancylobacter gelatini]
MALKTTKFDATDYLDTPEDIAAYLEAAFEDGTPALITAALGDVARSRGMTQIARDAGVAREALYRALSEGGNPEFATVLKVVKALGLSLTVAPAKAA